MSYLQLQSIGGAISNLGMETVCGEHMCAVACFWNPMTFNLETNLDLEILVVPPLSRVLELQSPDLVC